MTRTKIQSATALILCLCIWISPLKADATDLVRLSNVVVIATPGPFTVQAGATSFTLSVISWLSPAPTGVPTSLPVVWQAQTQARQAPLTTPGPGIWYLKDLGNGSYSPVAVSKFPGIDGLYQKVAARGGCPSALSYPPNAQLTDKIALELACAAVLENTDYQAATNAVGTAPLASSPAVHGAFTYLAQLPGSRQKSVGIACLIATGEASALPLLERSLSQLTDQDLARVVAGPLGAFWRDSNPAAIQSLGRVATGPRAQGMLLFDSATALQEIHTADTLPYLAKLLESPDRSIRLRAYGGFISFVTGLPIHTQANTKNLDYIKTSPTPYSSETFWKSCTIRSDASDADLDASAACWKAWLQAHPELPQSH